MKKFKSFFLIILALFLTQCATRGARPKRPVRDKINKVFFLENLPETKKPSHPFNSTFKLFVLDENDNKIATSTAWALKQEYSPSKLLDTTLFVTAGHVCDQIKKNINDIGAVKLGTPLLEKEFVIDEFFNVKPFDVCIAYQKGQQLDESAGFELRDPSDYLSPMTKLFSIQGPLGVFPIVSEARVGFVDLSSVMFSVGMNSFFGSSGSPIFDENLKAVGMCVRIHTSFSYITIAMSVTSIRLILDMFRDFSDHSEIFFKILQKDIIKVDNLKSKI